MKWPEEYINQIICDDCLEVMKGMPSNCIDTIITDPPYGIGFMGKEWDVFKSEFVRKSVEKSNRNTVEKDGMASKSGIRYDESLLGHQKYQDWCVEWMEECLRIAKPGATFLCCGSPRVYHHIALATERAGWILKDCIMWLYGSGFPKATDISKQIDKGHKRKIVDKRKGTYADIRRDKNTGIAELHGGIATQKKRIKSYITAPATPEATLWNGWKSHGLKPAYEPILVAMKTNEGSYANNALKWKVAGLNIDGGRISLNGDKPRKANKGKSSTNIYGWAKGGINKSGEMPVKGRYPANVILDEEAGRMLDEQSGELKPPWGKESESQKNTSWFSGKTDSYGKLYRDIGGASRFFYCAKASRAERNKGCEELEEKERANINKMMGKAGNFKTGSGSDRTEKFKNNHPTVKPLALMKYLCVLTKTSTGGIVLDPFCGSGTTLMACKETRRKYIGIDNIPEYCEIARRRINATPEPLF